MAISYRNSLTKIKYWLYYDNNANYKSTLNDFKISHVIEIGNIDNHRADFENFWAI